MTSSQHREEPPAPARDDIDPAAGGPESTKLVALRKTLAAVAENLLPEAKRQVAEDAIHQVLCAFKERTGQPDTWEKRCLAAAISNIRGGKFDQARSLARRALWPEENRRDSAIPRFVLKPGMTNLDELTREFEAARAVRHG